MTNYKHGEIIWRDLTVEDAENTKAFYESVLDWKTSPHDMENYHDYNVMLKDTDEIFTGICHQKSSNQDLPIGWLNYIYVDDVALVIEKCINNGGTLLIKRKMGPSDFAVLKDPSGATFAIIH